MIFSPKENQIVGGWSSKQAGAAIPIVLPLSSDPRGDRFRSFCDELSSMAPCIEIITGDEREPGVSAAGVPVLLLGKSWRFHALPLGSELEPFLEVLSSTAAEGSEAGSRFVSGLPEPVMQRLSGVKDPINLKVFVSTQCPYCPRVIREIIPLAIAAPHSTITVIDPFLFSELADGYNIKAVPTLILNESYRWTGQVSLTEILEVLDRRDPSQLEAETLKRMLHEGQAGRVARMMLEEHLVFPAFIDLLCSPEWSARLGAMVVVEEIAEEDPELARTLLPLLWERFPVQDSPVKGDIVYLIGELGAGDGDTDWAERIRSLLQDSESEEDIRDLALEALSRLA